MLEKIKFNYEVAEKQNELFTPSHRKYVCIIKYNGRQYTFDFQCNPNYSKPNVKVCIECLFLAFAYDNAKDIFDFADKFGYVVNKETERFFKDCKKISNAMHRLFTDEELEELENEINKH